MNADNQAWRIVQLGAVYYCWLQLNETVLENVMNKNSCNYVHKRIRKD